MYSNPVKGKPRARILVVDDDRDIASYLGAVLTMDGYQAIETHRAEQAIELIREEPPDLVLTDLMMPGMGGLGLLTYLKNNHDLPFIPVIMVTALQEATINRAAALEAGCDDFLTKPVNNSELKARVRSLLRFKRATDVLSRKLSQEEREAAWEEIYQAERGGETDNRPTPPKAEQPTVENILNDLLGKVQAALAQGNLAGYDLVEIAEEIKQALSALHKPPLNAPRAPEPQG